MVKCVKNRTNLKDLWVIDYLMRNNKKGHNELETKLDNTHP